MFRDPGIKTGFRKINQPWSYYIRSIFTIHNETINIWTHMLAIFWHIYLIYDYSESSNYYCDDQYVPILIYGLSCVLSSTASTAAHIFHSKSLYIHQVLFLLDIAAICFFTFANGLLTVTYWSDEKTFNKLHTVFIVTNWILAFLDLSIMCVLRFYLVETSKQFLRKFLSIATIGCHIIFVSLPVIPNYIRYFNGDKSYASFVSQYNFLLLLILLIGVMYTSHVPEVFFPGVFDIVGTSHQVFHVLVTITQTLQIQFVHSELASGRGAYASPSNGAQLIVSSLVLLLIFLCGILFVTGQWKANNETKSG